MLSAIESTVSLIMRTCSAGDDDDGVRRFFSMPSRELRCCFSWALQRFASSSTSAGGWSAALKDGRPTEEERREWRARSGESNDVSRRTKSSSAPRRPTPWSCVWRAAPWIWAAPSTLAAKQVIRQEPSMRGRQEEQRHGCAKSHRRRKRRRRAGGERHRLREHRLRRLQLLAIMSSFERHRNTGVGGEHVPHRASELTAERNGVRRTVGAQRPFLEQMRQRSLGRTNSAKWGKNHSPRCTPFVSHAASGLPPLLPSPGDVLE